jgi:hypothetical protein
MRLIQRGVNDHVECMARHPGGVSEDGRTIDGSSSRFVLVGYLGMLLRVGRSAITGEPRSPEGCFSRRNAVFMVLVPSAPELDDHTEAAERALVGYSSFVGTPCVSQVES